MLDTGGYRWGLGAVLAAGLAGLAGVGAAPTAAPSQCCPQGVRLKLHPRACADGSEVPLHCSPVFLLDQDNQDDKWIERPDGTLLVDNFTIHQFCLARMLMGQGEQPHEVALVCSSEMMAGDPPPEDPRPQWWFEAAAALSWLSVACLALTLAAHVALPELRDLQGRCHMAAVASLGLGLLVLAVLQEVSLDGSLCTTMAFLVYYWLLSAFFWLNITSFNVWRSVVLEHMRFRERVLFRWYAAVSWGAPLLVLLVLLTAHLLPEDHNIIQPKFGKNKCWFHDDRATWAWFYWPLAVLLGLNVVYFVWTTARLWQQYGTGNQCRGKLLRRRFLLSLKLFLIMGISWIFELISSAADNPGYNVWYLTDTFNAMQGVVILLVLVVFRRRVWRALHKRRPCGVRPPEQWAFPPGDAQEDCESTDSEDDYDGEAAHPARHRELKDMTGRAANGRPKL